MANERVTEDIVRTHFKTDPLFSQVILEEQKSKNPRVDKALTMASKSAIGTGKGRPEFIVTFPGLSDLIVIVECKSSTTKHESPKRDKYADYAVDGVLLYASYLSAQFDVIAIAVSGESLSTIKISHFRWKKGTSSGEDRPADIILLSFQSYIASYKSLVALSQIEEAKIAERAVYYNELFHDYSIPETERATIISSILVSLQDDAFRSAFRKLKKPSDIADNILSAAKRVLNDHTVDPKRQEVVLAEYNTIRNQDITRSETISKAGLSIPVANDILKQIIIDIYDHVFPLIASGQSGLDVLGRFYTEFIRYSGSDARTGLVLTPPHITNLFCDVIGLSVNDVVIDPCCGTGGFLTAAMKYMCDKAGNDENTKELIRKSRLVGIERRTDMFTHAISNMMMRGDGKSNIFRGNCFEDDIKAEVLKLCLSVAMLNPPYDVGAVGQLEFVDNALSLVPSGRCIAICQMSVAVQQTSEIIAMRDTMLKKHTLEAVMSMPHDLFHPVGAVTCVLLFKSNHPHPIGYKTYFGYWRNDGFVKRKHRGRISDGTWPHKKQKMLESFINRENHPGLSVMRAVRANDEWCAEAYMETDLSGLEDRDFIFSIRGLIAFRLMEADSPAPVSAAKVKAGAVSLSEMPWKDFSIKDLFNVKKGRRLTKADMTEGDTPFIGAVEINNGLTCRIDADPIHKAGTITVVYNGNGVATSFYQEHSFWCTDDVNVLYPKFEMSSKVALFICTIIRREKYRFNYGRKWGKERMMESNLKLPSNGFSPNWKFIESYIDSLPFSADLYAARTEEMRELGPPDLP